MLGLFTPRTIILTITTKTLTIILILWEQCSPGVELSLIDNRGIHNGNNERKAQEEYTQRKGYLRESESKQQRVHKWTLNIIETRQRLYGWVGFICSSWLCNNREHMQVIRLWNVSIVITVMVKTGANIVIVIVMFQVWMGINTEEKADKWSNRNLC